jgi:hypothetical protein
VPSRVRVTSVAVVHVFAEAGDNAEMALPEAQELMALIEQSISADAGEVAHRAP